MSFTEMTISRDIRKTDILRGPKINWDQGRSITILLSSRLLRVFDSRRLLKSKFYHHVLNKDGVHGITIQKHPKVYPDRKSEIPRLIFFV